jgi:hypothetical protein
MNRLDDPLRPLPAREFGFWEARHLLFRAGFGGTPEQVRAIAGLGLEGAVDYLLEWDEIPAKPVEASLFARTIRSSSISFSRSGSSVSARIASSSTPFASGGSRG